MIPETNLPDMKGSSVSGVGVDLIAIERIRRSVQKHGNAFLKRVFTKEERRFCEQKSVSAQHYAARFAAKEAIMKLLGTGWGNGIKWIDISINRTSGEAPRVELTGQACAVADRLNIQKIHVSLSHSSTHAIAFCVGEH